MQIATSIDEQLAKAETASFSSLKDLMQEKAVTRMFVVVDNKRADIMLDLKDLQRAKVELMRKVILQARREASLLVANGQIRYDDTSNVSILMLKPPKRFYESLYEQNRRLLSTEYSFRLPRLSQKNEA